MAQEKKSKNQKTKHKSQGKSSVKNIEVKKKKTSGLASFTQRPVASDEEVQEFEDYLAQHHKDEDIKENLSEIYKDKKGNIINVKKVDIKKKSNWWLKLFKTIFILTFLLLFAGGVYYYMSQPEGNVSNLKLETDMPEQIKAGEEFFYTVNYENISDNKFEDVYLEVTYPENFIFLDSSVSPDNTNNTLWEIGDLASQKNKELQIKGKIINKTGVPNLFKTKAMFTPQNFSSEFQEIRTDSIILENIGFDLDVEGSKSALTGEEKEMTLFFDTYQDNHFSSFDLVFETPENIEIIQPDLEKYNESEDNLTLVKIERNTWKLKGLDQDSSQLSFKYRVLEKQQKDKETIGLNMKQTLNGQDYTFLERDIDIEILRSDLDLDLILNGSQNDQSINFGDTLNYSLVYYNKGEKTMKDVNIMAIVQSNYLDWDTLKEENEATRSDNTLIWTSKEVPGLKEIEPGEEGTINFSLETTELKREEIGRSPQVKSYAKFNMAELEKDVDNQSNTIVSTFNSSLNLEENIRYFTEDNVPVGSGPIPPQVGEKTTFKVYWSLRNDLHKLNEVEVKLNLPEYVEWEDTTHNLVGDLNYKENKHMVVWEVDELPVTDNKNQANFEISLTPKPENQGKIMVLSPGVKATAIDSETEDKIIEETKSKTTKLEDDDIAQLTSDGIIEESEQD